MWRFIWLICAGWLAACAAVPLVDTGEPTGIVYVYSNGWHSSIVLSRDALPPGLIPEAADFPAAAFLEFGWGDREFYPSPDPDLSVVLAAALTPTPAVMHVASLPRPSQEHYRDVEVLAVGMSAAALRRLVVGIDASFDRPDGGRGEHVARGLYEDSWFYAALGEFHFFNTCNTWAARMLSAAGVGASMSGVNTADDLKNRLRDLPNARQVNRVN